MREYDNMNTYWYLDSLDKFQNIEIHGINGDLKYLCCIGCQNEILGYQLISVSIPLSEAFNVNFTIKGSK